MSAWLYQMTTKDSDDLVWSPEDYRMEVWEGKENKWSIRKINERGQDPIKKGDIVIFFFAKNTKDCGIYGWAIITKIDNKKGQISFIPTFPSDYLKTTPLWNENIENLMNQIRVPIPQGTMWSITPDELEIIRVSIRRHLGHSV